MISKYKISSVAALPFFAAINVTVINAAAIDVAGAVDISLADTQSFSNQDRPTATVMPMDGGNALYLYGNTWRATTARYTIAKNSVLEFEFASDSKGEIHGIGFDQDNRISTNRIFKLYGTQNWGITGAARYTASDGSFQTFKIPVGNYFTGGNYKLVLVNDNDVQQASNTSQFRNVKLITAEGGVPGNDNPVVSSCINSVESALLSAHNNARARGRNCGSTFHPAAQPLSWNCKLAQAAENHSNDMAGNNFFSHTGSDGLKAWHRASALGYNYSAIAENIAAGYQSVDAVMTGWLNSPGHCKSIMNNRYKEMGSARVDKPSSSYRVYWTSVFGAQR